jgi:tetratricopeptide (TPR) repeat protein
LAALASLYGADAREQPDSAHAAESGRRGVAIYEKLVEGDNVPDQTREDLAVAYANLVTALSRPDQRVEAIDVAQKGVRIREALVASHPDHTRYLRGLAVAYTKLGDALILGAPTPADSAAALEYERKALAVAAKLSAADPADRRAANVHAVMLLRTARAMPEDRDHEAALALLRDSASIHRNLLVQDPGDAVLQRGLAATITHAGIRQARTGDSDGANRSLREAVRINEQLLAKNSKDLTALRYIVIGRQELAQLLAHKGQRADALDVARKAIAAAQAHRDADRGNTTLQPRVPQAYAVAGGVMATLAAAPGAPDTQRREDWRLASDFFQKAAAAWEQIQAQRIGTVDRDVELAKARTEAARCETALARLH